MHRDGDWYGNGVNVASRLCSAAGGGEVLVIIWPGAATGASVPLAAAGPPDLLNASFNGTGSHGR